MKLESWIIKVRATIVIVVANFVGVVEVGSFWGIVPVILLVCKDRFGCCRGFTGFVDIDIMVNISHNSSTVTTTLQTAKDSPHLDSVSPRWKDLDFSTSYSSAEDSTSSAKEFVSKEPLKNY